jgi:hypothetical protein
VGLGANADEPPFQAKAERWARTTVLEALGENPKLRSHGQVYFKLLNYASDLGGIKGGYHTGYPLSLAANALDSMK